MTELHYQRRRPSRSMSSENQPIRKAWVRHARGLVLRKWLLVGVGVGLLAWAAATVVRHHNSVPTMATPPVAEAPKTAPPKTAPSPQPAPKTALSARPQSKTAASPAAAPPPAAATANDKPESEPLRSAPAGENALILAPLAPSNAPTVQVPPQAPNAPTSSPPPVPELPTVAVAPPVVHVVPSDRETKRLGAVTMHERNGHTFTIVPAAPMPSPSTPNAAPPATASVPMPAQGFAPVVANPAVFSGHARAVGPLTLSVHGQTVALFGVKPAAPDDRCAAASGKPISCAALAQAALTGKLAGHSIVACRVPPGQRGTLGAICLDEQGNDLGRFLVIEGLALADSAQSYDYLPAESAAHSAKRGLWRFR